MLSKFYLFTITQLFTEGVHASSDVKSILRNREICDKVPGYCTSKIVAMMDDMADLVEITEDIFFPKKLIQLSVFSKSSVRRAPTTNQIARILRQHVGIMNNIISEDVASSKNEAEKQERSGKIRKQFAEYIRDNIVNDYDDYNISFDKYESKVAKTIERSKEMVHNYIRYGKQDQKIHLYTQWSVFEPQC